MKKRVFVTGMGAVTSVGSNCKEILDSLKNGKSGIAKSDYFHELVSDIMIAAEIKDNVDFKEYFDTNILKRIKSVVKNRASLQMRTVIKCLIEALEQAQIPDYDLMSLDQRTGIVIGGCNLTQNIQHSLHERYANSMEFVNPKYAIEFFDSNFIGVLSEIFGISDDGFVAGGASASGNVAIIQAYRLVSAGILDSCCIVSPMVDFSPYEIQAFKNLGVFGEIFEKSPEKACRPFDLGHGGFIFGQGTGALFIESEDSLKKRGAESLGEILGGSIKLDRNHLSDARVSGEMSSMKNAIKDAGISIEDIDYINAHGTSTPLGDAVEAEAISDIFSNIEKKPYVNSSKSIIGHCMFSAGLLEAIITLIQINNGFLHPNLNIDDPIAECKGFDLVGDTMQKCNVNYALNNSFGFGGINTSVVLKK